MIEDILESQEEEEKSKKKKKKKESKPEKEKEKKETKEKNKVRCLEFQKLACSGGLVLFRFLLLFMESVG